MISSFFNKYYSWRSACRRVLVPVLVCVLAVGGAQVYGSWDSSWEAQEAAALDYEVYEEGQLIREAFDEFTDGLFAAQVSASTLDLHYCLAEPEAYGIEDYEITLGTEAPGDIAASFDSLRKILETLGDFPREDLTEEQKLTYDILEDSLNTSLAWEDMVLYYEVLAPTTGIQVELPILLAEYTFRDLGDVEEYLALLEDIPRYFDTILELEKAKSEAGLFLCDALAEQIAEECLAFAADTGYLEETFEEKLEDVSGVTEIVCQEYITRHGEVLETSVVPAYEALAEGITSLMGTGQYEGGLCRYPQGKAYYEYLVRADTGSGKTVEEIRSRIAEQMVTDLTRMSELLEQDPELSTAEFSFTLTEPEEILTDLLEKISEDFPKLPVEGTDPTVRSVHPSLEASSSPAFYLTCPLDNLTENVIYINESSSTSAASGLYAVLAHEGYPGHLYQTVYSSSQYATPLRAVLSHPGYCEGWATYVEQLSYGWGDVNDADLAELYQLNSSVSLGLSSLLDIQIHYYGYDLEDAADFLSDYMTLDEETVEEIYYQILGNPANYLKYYVGYLEILDLREYTEELMGEDFSAKAFHQALLTIGEAPFDIIEEYLPSYLGAS